MTEKRKQFLLDLLRIVAVIIVALFLGFLITVMVSDEPVAAFEALLTGPFPKISFKYPKTL